MLRRALLLSVALAGILDCSDAWAAQTTVPVRGDVRAIAFSGDALIVARQPPDRGFTLERLTSGAAAQTLMRLPRSHDVPQVALEASPQAVAFGEQSDSEAYGPSHVFVGPPTGPLRDVAACAAGVLLAPVAVSGARVAWRGGGCGEPASDPRDVSPATVVIGGPDPAAPLRRLAVEADSLPASLALGGGTGFVGLLRPSFFAIKSEVRRLAIGSVAETVATESGRSMATIGVLPDGAGVFGLSAVEQESSSGDARCGTSLFAITPSSSQRRPLSLGGCPIDDSFPGSAARVAGDRIYALVVQRRKAKRGPRPVAITSVQGDGAGARVLARGTYRVPLGIAAAPSGRTARWQPRCAGGTEIVIDDGVGPASARSVPSCSIELRRSSARVHGHAITLRLRCPIGCSGQVIAETRPPRFLRSFSMRRGTHSLRLRLTRSERRRKRLALTFEVRDGRSLRTVLRLHSRPAAR